MYSSRLLRSPLEDGDAGGASDNATTIDPAIANAATIDTVGGDDDKPLPDKLKGQVFSLPSDDEGGQVAVKDDDADDTAQVDDKPLDKKPLDKKASTKKEPATTATATTPTTTVDPAAQAAAKAILGKRDYSVFAREDADMLKKLPNELFAHFSKRLPQLYAQESRVKELEGQVSELRKAAEGKMPESYYQHPQAYMLSPDYAEATEKLSMADTEAAHWRQQLLNIRAGKPWHDIVGYDKNGNLQLSQPLQATDEADINVTSAMQQAHMFKQQFSQQVTQLKNTFAQRWQQDERVVRDELAKRFPWVADAKLQDEAVDVGDGSKHPIKAVITGLQQLVPQVYRNHPMSDAWLHTYVGNLKLQERMKAVMAENTQLKQLQKDHQAAEPAASQAAAQTQQAVIKGRGKLTAVPTLDDLSE